MKHNKTAHNLHKKIIKGHADLLKHHIKLEKALAKPKAPSPKRKK